MIGIYGGTGQMGKVLTDLYASEEPSAEIVIFSRSHPERMEGPAPDVVIDFSHKDALTEVLAYCTQKGVPLVLATTGFDETQQAAVRTAAQTIPLFWSANLSLGIHVLKALARQAARLLGEDADIEIIERHHKRKKDAPSGTALLLRDAMAGERDFTRTVFGREGQSPRQAGEIGVHAVRGGSIVGEHTLLFAMDSETIELTHRGESRKLFARGAMKAAAFIQAKPAGLYGMDDLFRDDESDRS